MVTSAILQIDDSFDFDTIPLILIFCNFVPFSGMLL